MVNKGIITKINGDTVAVRLYKSSSCSHCSVVVKLIKWEVTLNLK